MDFLLASTTLSAAAVSAPGAAPPAPADPAAAAPGAPQRSFRDLLALAGRTSPDPSGGAAAAEQGLSPPEGDPAAGAPVEGADGAVVDPAGELQALLAAAAGLIPAAHAPSSEAAFAGSAGTEAEPIRAAVKPGAAAPAGPAFAIPVRIAAELTAAGGRDAAGETEALRSAAPAAVRVMPEEIVADKTPASARGPEAPAAGLGPSSPSAVTPHVGRPAPTADLAPPPAGRATPPPDPQPPGRLSEERAPQAESRPAASEAASRGRLQPSAPAGLSPAAPDVPAVEPAPEVRPREKVRGAEPVPGAAREIGVKAPDPGASAAPDGGKGGSDHPSGNPPGGGAPSGGLEKAAVSAPEERFPEIRSEAAGRDLRLSAAVEDRQLKPAAALPEREPVPPAPRSGIFDQIVQRAALLARDGRTEMRIDLKPEALGQVRLQIMTEHQQVSVRIFAEHANVREIIESHMTQLKSDLQQQGLQVDRLEVAVAEGERRAPGRQGNPGRRRPGAPGAVRAAAGPERIDAAAGALRPAGSGLIDTFI
jgi:hypothetical protein